MLRERNLLPAMLAVMLGFGAAAAAQPDGGNTVNNPGNSRMEAPMNTDEPDGQLRAPGRIPGPDGTMRPADGRRQDPGRGGEPGIAAFCLRNAGALDLTGEQTAKLRSGMTAFRKEEIEKRAGIEIERINLAELIAGDKTGIAAVEKQVGIIKDLEGALEIARIRADMDARSLLTPEQRKSLELLTGGDQPDRDKTVPGSPGKRR